MCIQEQGAIIHTTRPLTIKGADENIPKIFQKYSGEAIGPTGVYYLMNGWKHTGDKNLNDQW